MIRIIYYLPQISFTRESGEIHAHIFLGNPKFRSPNFLLGSGQYDR